ncbi:hypothetical protein O181_083838 [Austropuccinia psidii MF-1]|uniref:Uncharacterized protein n=1 Tax=Austropuccinia psidii MF-1 TaxID=1389203 RepID=A0A9Q3FUF4_9BASI|nr:hypothetical protein [Austropuccinia psidii MF-1]
MTRPSLSFSPAPLRSTLPAFVLLAQVAPEGLRNSSASHLFLARVHRPNHLRTIRLVSHNVRWLLRNPRRNLMVSHPFFLFDPYPLFLIFSSTVSHSSRHSSLHTHHQRYAHRIPPSPFFFTDSAIFPSTPTPVPSPELPPIAPENPTSSSPPVPSSSHSHDDTRQEFTDLRPTLMIP